MADKSRITSPTGGQYSVAVAAGTLANTPVSTVPGRLCRVSVTTSGSVDLKFYDSATTTADPAATLLCSLTGAAAVGTVVEFGFPVVNGILPLQVTSTPGVAVSYTKDTAYGL